MSDQERQRDVLSSEQGFAAMFEFLKVYRSELQTASVSDVLSDINPAYGGKSSDPAAWAAWLQAVETARAKSE
jgi:hypothetical protein